MKFRFVIFLFLIIQPGMSQKLQNLINSEEFLNATQKEQIYYHCSMFTDYVFVQSDLSPNLTQLYQEVMEVFFLEEAKPETVARGLYFAYLCSTKGFARDAIVDIAFPMALTRISAPQFLEAIEYYQFLLYEGFNKQQALQIIYRRSGYGSSLNKIKRMLGSHAIQSQPMDYKATIMSSEKLNNAVLSAATQPSLKRIYNYAKKEGGKEYAAEVTHAVLKHLNNPTHINTLDKKIKALSPKTNVSKPLIDDVVKQIASGSPATANESKKPSANSSRRQRIIQIARKYIGTPYRWGGNTIFGMDCSGFVQRVYLEAGLKLPRTSAAQKASSRFISIGKMKPGDLVFFATSGTRRISHVGIYLGNGKFIHASSSRGVTISNLSDNYYQKRLVAAGTKL